MVIASKARFLPFWPAFLLVLSINSFVSALDVPPLRARVNDLTKILTAEKTQQLEERLRQFEREISHQIAVLTFPALKAIPSKISASELPMPGRLAKKEQPTA